jgi:hypothetical protein
MMNWGITMSRITDYILEQEDSGDLRYNEAAKEYMKTEQFEQDMIEVDQDQGYDEYKETRAGLL